MYWYKVKGEERRKTGSEETEKKYTERERDSDRMCFPYIYI